MPERFFETNQRNTKKAVQQDLEDHGISHVSEWRNAFDSEILPGGQEVAQREIKKEYKVGKIDSQNWQRQLDIAFEEGDYPLVRTLLRVRPENAPSFEIIRNRLNELVTSRLRGWDEEFKKIRLMFHVEVDHSLLTQEFGKLSEQCVHKPKILDQLRYFVYITGYNPESEIMQARYRAILNDGRLSDSAAENLLKHIRSFILIKPEPSIFYEMLVNGQVAYAQKIASLFEVEITSDVIQRAYEDAFEKNGHIEIYQISRIAQIGEKPNVELVQRAYLKIIEGRNDRWVDSFQSLKQATGVEPVFADEQVRPFFEKYLNDGLYKEVKKLAELTGIHPDADLVRIIALKVIDNGHGSFDQGKRIKYDINKLRESVGVEFEISESDIQSRYQQAIMARKPHIILNLFGAFEIKPSIDPETARQFMLGFMDETYHNPVQELEKAFGIKFKATQEEIKAKQDGNLEKFQFDKLVKIEELTGKECDKQKLEEALVRLLQKEATTPIHERGTYGSDWQKTVKHRLEQFGVIVRPEDVVSIYNILVQNEIIYSTNIAKIHEITQVPIPPELVQQAYEKILSPRYVASVKTDKGVFYNYGLSSALAEIYKASGIVPQVPVEKVQQFYRSQLDVDGGNASEIKKTIELTGIQPIFDSEDINNLYKQWILSGKEKYIKDIQEVTGIDPQFDGETLAYVSKFIEAEIEKLGLDNYEVAEYGEKRFDINRLEQKLEKVNTLTLITGIKVDNERLQEIYTKILTSDPYWPIKIEKIIKVTGIKTGLNFEQAQGQGEHLLETDVLVSLKSLQKYGQFIISSEVAIKAYDVFLQSISRYRTEYWTDKIISFKELTGIGPTEQQYAEMILVLFNNEDFARRSQNRIVEAAGLLQESFGVTVSESMARDIFKELFVIGDFEGIEGFRKKTGVTPEVPAEIVQKKCDELLQKRDLNTLRSIKGLLNLDSLPLTPEIVQGEYKKLFDNPKFAAYGDEDIEMMYALYDLTQTRPELSAEQLSNAYKELLYYTDGKYEKFERVVGVPPSERDLQNQAYYYLVDDYVDRSKESFTKFVEKHNITIPEEVVARAIERQLEKATTNSSEKFLKNVALITELTGVRVPLSPEKFSSIVEKLLDGQKIESHSGFVYIAKLFTWFEEYTGSRPKQSLVEKAYLKTFGISAYGLKRKDGREYINGWDWLRDRYGFPSTETIQGLYFEQLKSGNVQNIDSIELSTGVKPSIKKMVRVEQRRGVEIEEEEVKTLLQNLFEQELLLGNIGGVRKLEEQFGRDFTIEPGDLQVLYTQVIMQQQRDKCEPEIYKFLLKRTKIAPSPEIIEARYRTLFEISSSSPSDLQDIADFQKMVEVPPASEIVQGEYKKLFDEYIHSYRYDWNDDEEIAYEDHGDKYFATYVELIQVTGIQPQFDRDYALKLYEFCVTSGSQYHQKIGVIAQETEVAIDQDFIQKYLLDNPEFSSTVPLSISNDQLNKHFSNPKNKSLSEYKRIYQVFGCFDYYQGVLMELEQGKSRGSKQQVIAVLAAMGLRDMENEERYGAIKEKLMAFVEEKSTPINKSLGEALAELAKNGDADLLSYLASTLRERTKATKGKENEHRALGFSPLQEVSLRTLSHVDNPVANEHLLALLSVSDIDPRVRSLILKNLVTEKRGFFPDNMRTWAEAELTDKKSKFPWEDLRYLQATNQIPSADLRRKSLRYLNDAFGSFTESKASPSEFQRKACESVPDNIFLPLWKFARGDQALLEKFNDLYKVTKASAEKDALLFGIVNTLSINQKTLGKVIDRLGEIDLIAPGAAQELGSVLKTLSFLDTVERELGQSREETLTILDSPVESLISLNESLKQVAVQKIKEVLPHEGVNAEAIQSLWEHWGSLEPIFIYAGKMASSNHDGTLSLVAEMVAHMDAPGYEVWKNWRYNSQDRTVREQIGHLTDAQLEVWKGDSFAELGDIMIAATPSDKPKQISRFIEGALREGHIYNSQIDTTDRHKFIQERLGAAYTAITEHPDQRETILNSAIELLQADIEKIDAITRFSNLPKLEQALTLFAEGKNVPVNAKTKNSIGFLAQFLSKEQFQEIEKVYKETEKSEASSIDTSRLINLTIRGLLMAKMGEINLKYEEVLQDSIFEQYGLNKEQLKNAGQFYQKRQELKALVDLYRVSALDVKRIATNRISDRVDKKGETLTKVIEGLKTYFKDNPTFIQDIENIHAVISQREDLGAKRRLAMIVTDSPQMLFQAGKYPAGCGSCQNYEGSPVWNKSLAGYVSDAHIKVAYLIDLNKLPDGLRSEIESKGFEEVKETIPHQDLLEASIARAITKITKVSEGSEPTLFIEPTYSSINKGDLTMDKYFNIFLELMASEPMGIRLTRGGGSETVRVPKSRNPSGQYEDCVAGNAGNAGMGIQTGSYTMSARFIDKFTPVSEADRELAARISGE